MDIVALRDCYAGGSPSSADFRDNAGISFPRAIGS